MLHARPQRSTTRFVTIAAVALAMVLAGALRAQASSPAAAPRGIPSAKRIQKLVDAMRRHLAVRNAVTVELVDSNPRRASVEPVKGAVNKTFKLSIERRFLAQLTADELKAVIAHELGHVWIYTHHPYLQTEWQANQIAMRVVSRETLATVYGKVWASSDSPGSLPRLPETQPAITALGDPPPR